MSRILAIYTSGPNSGSYKPTETPQTSYPAKSDSRNSGLFPTRVIAHDISVEGVIAAGSAVVVLPNWTQMPISEVTGNVGTEQDGGILYSGPEAPITIMAQLKAKATWGQYVAFGVSWDDAGLFEIGRVQINSNEFVLTQFMGAVLALPGKVMKLWISSTFEWGPTEWGDGIVGGILTN